MAPAGGTIRGAVVSLGSVLPITIKWLARMLPGAVEIRNVPSSSGVNWTVTAAISLAKIYGRSGLPIDIDWASRNTSLAIQFVWMGESLSWIDMVTGKSCTPRRPTVKSWICLVVKATMAVEATTRLFASIRYDSIMSGSGLETSLLTAWNRKTVLSASSGGTTNRIRVVLANDVISPIFASPTNLGSLNVQLRNSGVRSTSTKTVTISSSGSVGEAVGVSVTEGMSVGIGDMDGKEDPLGVLVGDTDTVGLSVMSLMPSKRKVSSSISRGPSVDETMSCPLPTGPNHTRR